MINISMDAGQVENCRDETLVITITGAECRLQDCQAYIQAEMKRLLDVFRDKDRQIVKHKKKPCGCGEKRKNAK